MDPRLQGYTPEVRADTVALTTVAWSGVVQVLSEVYIYAPAGSVSVGIAPFLPQGDSVPSTLVVHTTASPRYVVPAGWRIDVSPNVATTIAYVVRPLIGGVL